MSMAYFASFDTRVIPAGDITLAKVGGGTPITLAPNSLNLTNGFGNRTYFYNHVIDNSWPGMDYAQSRQLKTFSPYTFFEAIAVALRAAAITAGWPSPATLDIQFDVYTRRARFVYPTGLTSIAFANAAMRALFGFAAAFAGSSTAVTGTRLPTHIIEPVLDGASAASTVYEVGPISSLGFSVTGRSYSLARTQAPLRRKWVQQYEGRGSVFKSYAAPDTYTFEDLFVGCRSGLPFAVVDGFADGANDGVLTAYCLERGSEAFHPLPAVPGSYDQFHIPFQTVAVGRAASTLPDDALVYDLTGEVLGHDGEVLVYG